MLHMCTLLLDILGVQPDSIQQRILVCITHKATVMLSPRLVRASSCPAMRCTQCKCWLPESAALSAVMAPSTTNLPGSVRDIWQ